MNTHSCIRLALPLAARGPVRIFLSLICDLCRCDSLSRYAYMHICIVRLCLLQLARHSRLMCGWRCVSPYPPHLSLSLSIYPSLSIYHLCFISLYLPIHISIYAHIIVSLYLPIYIYTYVNIYSLIRLALPFSARGPVRISLSFSCMIYIAVSPYLDMHICIYI